MWVRQSEMSDFIQAVKVIRRLVPTTGNHASFVKAMQDLSVGDSYDLTCAIDDVKRFGGLIGGKEMEILQEIGK